MTENQKYAAVIYSVDILAAGIYDTSINSEEFGTFQGWSTENKAKSQIENPHSFSSYRFEAFNAVLKASKDFERDKQNPFDAGTKGNSGKFPSILLNESGPKNVKFS